MNIEELTCIQFVEIRMKEYKKTNYYKNALKLKEKNPVLSSDIIKQKEEKFIEHWKQYIEEYGRKNILENKVIYSYIKQFGYENLLYEFRGDRQALKNFIPTEKYTI